MPRTTPHGSDAHNAGPPARESAGSGAREPAKGGIAAASELVAPAEAARPGRKAARESATALGGSDRSLRPRRQEGAAAEPPTKHAEPQQPPEADNEQLSAAARARAAAAAGSAGEAAAAVAAASRSPGAWSCCAPCAMTPGCSAGGSTRRPAGTRGGGVVESKHTMTLDVALAIG